MNQFSQQVHIATSASAVSSARIMIIYTGGTFGMVHNEEGMLEPFTFNRILEHLPALRRLALNITGLSFENPVDSSNMEPEDWRTVARAIALHYHNYDGFIILHGTDTMAYTSSALSFMLQGLAKPVVITGAQLPVSEPRSDARKNLITSLEIASAYHQGIPIVPEVCIYFNNELIRGCRAKKNQSTQFAAFQSGNYPLLAKAGVKINYAKSAIRTPAQEPLQILDKFDSHVFIFKLFPGINITHLQSILDMSHLKGLILETYGSGNAPIHDWFITSIQKLIQQGVLVLNISQCSAGNVVQGRYKTSKRLAEVGVVSGRDMTIEAAMTKLMLAIGEYGVEKAKDMMELSWAGELTPSSMTNE